MRRGASFDTCFALSASICIVACMVYCTMCLMWLCIYIGPRTGTLLWYGPLGDLSTISLPTLAIEGVGKQAVAVFARREAFLQFGPKQLG